MVKLLIDIAKQDGHPKKLRTFLRSNYEFILETLYFVQQTDATPAGSNSTPLLKATKDFEFIFVLQVLFEIFKRTGIFSNVLQDSQLEIDKSIRLKTTTIQSLSDIKTDDKFEKLYKYYLKIAEENDLDKPILPRQRRIPDRFKDSFPKLARFN